MATLTLPPEAYRYELARRKLERFLPYVRIPDPPPQGRGIVAFEQWPHLMRLHEEAQRVRPGGVLPVGKARKLGVTSYFEARDTHKALFTPGAVLPVISQGKDEAKKVIAECRFIWEHLPDELRQELVIDNVSTLSFLGGGRIEAFPATSKAGRSWTGTDILFDEADFHDEFEESYNALLPLIQDTGGKMFLVSTPNKKKVDSAFRRIFQKMDNRLFLGYYERPNRTEETYRQAMELASDADLFEQENPRNVEEFLAPSKAKAYFDVDSLAWLMAERVQEPMEVVGQLSVWKPAVVGLKYVLGVDTAWGQTGSYNAAAVFEWQTGEQVAELHGRLHPNDMAYEVMEIHKRYNHAYMGLERAGEGQERDGDSVVVVDKVVEMLKECSCSGRLYYNDHDSPNPKEPGWVTDSKSRPYMLGEFREAVRNKQTTIRSRRGVGEMMSFIRNDRGRAEAAQGANDDLPICYAIAWQMRKYARYSASTGQGIRMPYRW
ncbi:MAG: hypothetical protein ABID84_03230 [Chloroflexota bacterium]